MKGRKLKPFVVPFMYVFLIAMLLGGVFVAEQFIRNRVFQADSTEEEVEEVVNTEEETYTEDVPVVATEPVIGRPYTNGSVKIVKNYYDYQGEESVQEDSLPKQPSYTVVPASLQIPSLR